jgi:hypothetical protein
LPFQLGAAQSFERLTVTPLFGRDRPGADYLSLDQGSAHPEGFVITEVDDAGEVTALLASNPLDRPVLLYEGEEVAGAKQNRMIARPLLVPAKTARLTVPVSCVE